MSTTDSVQLLRAYAECGDEAAFRELVAAYIDLVYSTAFRRVGHDAELARDVTQTVFTDLARKARSLRGEVMLGGWLHRHTGFVAATVVRGERRRQAREQQAAEMNALQDSPDSLWQQLAPCLDETIDALDAPDRQAIVLRFFERRDFNSIGAALGISDDAAQKRVSRALEKLRAMLVQRGVTPGVTLLAGLMAGKIVSAAPAGLEVTVSRAALAAVASGAGFTVALMKLVSTLTFKLGLGTVAIVAVAVLSSRPPANKNQVAATQNEILTQAQAGNTATPAIGGQNLAAEITSGESTATSNKLVLRIVAADTGEPVPMVTVDYRLRSGTTNSRKQLVSTRLGVCEVLVPRDTVTSLLLTSQIEGFADTSLQWRVDRGEKIPEEYTLRLTRPVQIGGQVVDAAGQPVAGARISFRALALSAGRESQTSTEFHAEGYAMGITDSQGQWRLSRLAPEVFRRVNACSANHPEHGSSELVSIAGDPETEKQMLAGTHVFHLKRGVTARGIVVDASGQPVPDATIAVSHLGGGGGVMRTATSQADGSFSMIGCTPGSTQLRVDAKGFTRTTLQVEVETNSAPFRVMLQVATPVRLRVVDQGGAPVPQATVSFSTFTGGGSVRQIEFTGRTDDQGRLSWEGAPNKEFACTVTASGSRRVSVQVKPAAQEQVITLPALAALVVSGTVRDATNGQAVTRFRITAGLQTTSRGGVTNTDWRTVPWMSFEDGRFLHTYRDLKPDSGVVFKFEAEGYAPVVTRVVGAGESQVRFDVALRPALAVKVTVLLPEGQPAVGTEIGLVSPDVNLRLVPGAFWRPGRNQGFSARDIAARPLTTDDQGRFELPDDPAITRIVIPHPDGFAEATPAALAAEPTLRLKPWGRVEGTFLTGGKPAAGRMLGLQIMGQDQSRFGLDPQAYSVQTDASGRFAFPKVPTGRLRLVMGSAFGSPGFGRRNPIMEVAVRSDETATATISAFTITARLRWPTNLIREASWSVVAEAATPMPDPPAESTNDPQAAAAWRALPAVAYHQVVFFRENADGTLVADDVLAGSYEVRVLVTDDSGKLWAQAMVPMTISADSTSSAIDLGEILLRPAQ